MRQQFNMFAGIMAVIICFVFSISFVVLVLYLMFHIIKHPIEKKQREKNVNELLKQDRIEWLKKWIKRTNSPELREQWTKELKLIESSEV